MMDRQVSLLLICATFATGCVDKSSGSGCSDLCGNDAYDSLAECGATPNDRDTWVDECKSDCEERVEDAEFIGCGEEYRDVVDCLGDGGFLCGQPQARCIEENTAMNECSGGGSGTTSESE